MTGSQPPQPPSAPSGASATTPPPRRRRGPLALLAVLLVLLGAVAWIDPLAGQSPARATSPAGGAHGIVYSTGVNSGRWRVHDLAADDMALLHARNVRVGVDIGTSTAVLDGAVAQYHAKGITVLLVAEFLDRVPSPAEARSLAGWAHRYGRGGAFWRGKSRPTPVKWIEFGNETAYTYQFADNSDRAYGRRAEAYARRVRDARRAMVAAGPAGRSVGLLAQADPDPRWAAGMFAAVPDLDARVAGWTVHPYGPLKSIAIKMDSSIANLAAVGAAPSAAKPLFVTEYGIASDDGRRLRENYGWPTNLTYAETAKALLAAERKLRGDYGDRLRLLIIYSGRDLREPGATDVPEDYFGSLRRNGYRRGNGVEKGAVTRAIRRIMDHGA